MRFKGRTVLVTGGATGIGLGIAGLFHGAGSTVIVCGRRELALARATIHLPGLVTFQCDLAQAAERERLAAWLARERPALDVVVNNAGVQERMDVRDGDFWARAEEEIAINLMAPVHLAHLLRPQLAGKPEATIVNVSSGLAFVPMAKAPVYSASKAALHSFTLSLRAQLAADGIRVIEIIPPAVDTDLGGPGRHRGDTPVPEFIDAVEAQLLAGSAEVTHGFSRTASQGSRAELDAVFTRING